MGHELQHFRIDERDSQLVIWKRSHAHENLNLFLLMGGMYGADYSPNSFFYEKKNAEAKSWQIRTFDLFFNTRKKI